VRKVKTPGGELKLHYVGKKGSGPRCGDCKKKLHGVLACTRPARTEEEAAMAAMAALRAL
jgi:ribosomal protein L34E